METPLNFVYSTHQFFGVTRRERDMGKGKGRMGKGGEERRSTNADHLEGLKLNSHGEVFNAFG